MQLCCGGWGDVALPRAPGEIEGYVASARGREPVPEWLLEVVRILAEDGAPHFKPLKIRAWLTPSFCCCMAAEYLPRAMLVHTLPRRTWPPSELRCRR